MHAQSLSTPDICTRVLETPVGTLAVRGTAEAIVELLFDDLHQYSNAGPLTIPVRDCLQQLTEYFDRKRQQFDLPLQPEGTPFRQAVWKALTTIPYGKTISYGDLARAVGNVNGQRAVGNANHHNPIAIVVPCHRVVGANGKLTGYAGGLWRKEWLLRHEMGEPVFNL
jgi:methylated-DNA-[protein]-cysteine S-methyltransferase